MWDAAGDMVEHLAGAEDFPLRIRPTGRRSPAAGRLHYAALAGARDALR
jgi:hypothetical protein